MLRATRQTRAGKMPGAPSGSFNQSIQTPAGQGDREEGCLI
jgi:hypothetical protein